MTSSVATRRDVVTTRDRTTSPFRRTPRASHRLAGGRVRNYFSRPGWPLAVALVPFALWWALGITEIVCVAMAVPMALHLMRQRRVEVPRGFGFWLVFLFLVIAGVAVLQVNAAGAVPSQSSTRYITWAYRVVWYLACTTAVLYVLNIRKHVPLERVSRIVSCLFLTIVAGGVLGLIAPHFEFPSLLELILPKGVDANQFVRSIIHPSAAQLQDILGHQAPRPSAPYAYTNNWGMNFCVTLPFFVHAWCGKQGGWRRWVAPLILLVAAVTAIESVNRGMWIALGIMAIFLAVRSALAGRPAIIVGVTLAGVAIAALLAATSLGTVVNERLSNPGSEQGRQNLTTLTARSVVTTSPLIGLGSTRNVQGNFQSIAGGATANCPRCSPPALGTQGQLWLVLFSQGLVGLAMFLAFFGISFFRYLRRRTSAVTLGLLVIVASAATAPFYDSLGTGLFVTMIGVAVLARDEAQNPSAGPLRALGDYTVPVARWAPLILLCALLGAVAGDVIVHARPKQATAVATVVVPSNPKQSVVPASVGPMTIDTLAQLLNGERVLDAVGRATGHRPAPGDGSIAVTATPNSRTLHIAYTARTPGLAKAGVTAAAATFVDVSNRWVASERSASLAVLQHQSRAIAAALKPVDDLITRSASGRPRSAARASTLAIRAQRLGLLTQLSAVQRQIAELTAATVQPGVQIQPITVHPVSGARRVDIVGGAVLGFLIGAVGAVALGRRGRRSSSRRAVFEEANVPVLAVLQLTNDKTTDGALGIEATQVIDTVVAVHGFGSCLPVDERDIAAVEVAVRLQDLATARRGNPRIGVVVASEDARTSVVSRARTSAQGCGISIIGLIVLARPVQQRPATASHRPFRNDARGVADEEKPCVTHSD